VAHTLHIDTAKGFLYPHGRSIDLANIALDLNDDPFDPKSAGKIPFFQYTHDEYVNNDTLYGAQINEGMLSIIDMWAAGVYFVQLSKNGATIQTIKVIKTG
jgi:hypothetical protein